ncbi:undecaprenyldiphospho-muramoylpentapeptide beta-N-acetylglucosaminyltransferase [Leadbetterella sp. DM7]|uniref:undecaprenyldiphospho-muramoylpentapeptide beta-N-acetylglucosaminyltransferase n=1 Tax=Leadbetterella sp. DM7 TaxID=3235085 RepID=UPI00349EC2A2
MKVIISGGGTGGHIYPAVAIANELKRQRPDAGILFVGALGKMEMEKVPREGYTIVGLPVAGFNRSNLLANVTFPFKLFSSLLKGYKVVKSFRPDIAVGVGGFASGPTLRMAGLLGVKTLIQEQNSYAGVTNKILARKAEKVCVAYPDMDQFFDASKIVFTGNPVRNDMLLSGISSEEARSHFGLDPQKPALLIIGGSLGALSINRAVAAGLDALTGAGLQVIWQTGKPFVEEARALAKDRPGVFVSDFIYEMDKAYAAARLVVSRAGALAVSELALIGKASILVPFPYAAEDHQTKNAESLSRKNAALLIPDSRVNEELVPAVTTLLADPDRIAAMENAIKAFARPKAAEDIVNEILKLVEK